MVYRTVEKYVHFKDIPNINKCCTVCKIFICLYLRVKTEKILKGTFLKRSCSNWLSFNASYFTGESVTPTILSDIYLYIFLNSHNLMDY